MMETINRKRVDGEALDALFREARTHGAWLPRPVPEDLLREAYDLAKMGPTSANSSPARFVFLTTEEAKERLIPALMPGNVEKTRSAPVTVIVAQDMEFYEQLPRLWPHGRRPELVRGQPRADRRHRGAEQQPARGLPHARGPRPRPRLRADVGVRRGEGQRGVLPRREMAGELPLQPRLRRFGEAPPACASA